jgi:hypothetical protein
VHFLIIPKIEIKRKVNVDKNNFLYFQCIECTNFKTNFYLFMCLISTSDVLFNIFQNLFICISYFTLAQKQVNTYGSNAERIFFL